MASHTQMWKLMATMYSTPSKNSDVLIVVNGRKLYFYKQLLCLVSPVFKSMLCSDFKEKKTQTINLEGKRFADIVLLLAWIDPAVTFTIDEYRAKTLLPLADEYDIANLRQTCEQVLCVCSSKGSLNVILRYLQLAEQFNLKDLFEKALTRAAELNIKQEDVFDKTHTAIEDSTLITILEKRAKIREQRYGYVRQATQLKPVEPPSKCTEAVEESKYSAATDLTDVTIIVHEKRLYFFSDILHRSSSWFADKLDEIGELGEISLDVGSYNEISRMLGFLDPTNEDKSFVNVETTLLLFWLSLEYDITVLHEACENYLKTNISQFDEHDLTRCILLADRGQCSELMTTAMRETRNYQISAVIATESYTQLDTNTLIQLLKFYLQDIN